MKQTHVAGAGPFSFSSPPAAAVATAAGDGDDAIQAAFPR